MSMKKIQLNTVFLLIALIFSGCQKNTPPPAPYGALPTERQQEWHQLETYAFLHFTTNTFTDKEWGYGDESEEVFNPTDFDADQIIGTLAKTGFKGAILTAKHHDGFCLWPSEFTEHSVKNSPWKDGKGDVVREISDACKKYGIKFGVYLSPWDRNYPDYGNEKYIEYYRNQLNELLTNYGDVFEVWFDGANGGDGYYGGKRETRKIDRSTYYKWDEVTDIVRELQPHAVIFSDAGPDLRWVGNEHGHANDSCWATYTPEPGEGETVAVAGTTKYKEGETGTQNGKLWMPAEVDVSIRPGWFYHASQDDKVKSLADLLDIYFHSVGNGTSLNLNIPPDRRGKIHEIDSLRLTEFHNYLTVAFSDNLLTGSQASAENVRGKAYAAAGTIDANPESYWATKDDVLNSSIVYQLPENKKVNCVVLQEYIPLGQRIQNFKIEAFINGNWQEAATGATIGAKKIVRFTPVETKKIKIYFSGMACPAISEVGAYLLPDIE
ncbi:MAG: alpha-L-fucosidase [Draconibacterium sp.]